METKHGTERNSGGKKERERRCEHEQVRETRRSASNGGVTYVALPRFPRVDDLAKAGLGQHARELVESNDIGDASRICEGERTYMFFDEVHHAPFHQTLYDALLF